MDYYMKFTVEGLYDLNIIERLRKALLDIDGVNDVEITEINRVSVAYDPTIVIPGQITAKMRAVGIKPKRG
ncbi:MAG: hypothetical protein A4E55_00602 [Pelotomaculum sp. PtaU1.Bin035]|nr:MAG: hypothetical protein A4E55_00602 [Pelotomaculum sp. PtaU1.Bin035]